MPELVIVESPGKIRKIGKILGDRYVVKASLGHVRDLPKTSTRSRDGVEPPLEESVGLTFDGRWIPTWELMASKKSNVSEIKKLGARGTVWLATDLDREGEAIAWHLREILGGEPGRFRRVTFSEITEGAVRAAFEQPRSLDMDLVSAYLARRFLDRVVGYTVSPLLSSKLYAGVSAGRVQSAALGILADRDEQIRVFEAKPFFGVGVVLPVGDPEGDRPVAEVLDSAGGVARYATRGQAVAVLEDLRSSTLELISVESSRQVQKPKPPFTTSSLQQMASSMLKFSVAKTMEVAQKLYEAGAITYMRSDAVFLAPESIAAARAYLEQVLGADSMPAEAPSYVAKAGAQEAHEAIRPSDPAKSGPGLGLVDDQAKLYALIRARLLASQMKSAVFERTDWALRGGAGGRVPLVARGRVVLDAGWQAVLPPVSAGDEPPVLPAVEEPFPVWRAGEFTPELQESFTKPSKRYTEAALVAELESKGVGRPSTYAATLEKLVDRGYVFLDKRLFVVSPFGRVVDAHLRRNFGAVRDVEYTSKMETLLDRIAAGRMDFRRLLDHYWEGLSAELDAAGADPALVPTPRPVVEGMSCPKCSTGVYAWVRKGVLKAVCRSKKCGFEEVFDWAPKKVSRRRKEKESADNAAVEDAAAEQRASGRCPRCSGGLQRWKAKAAGVIDLCAQWPACDHLQFAGGARAGGKSPKSAKGGKTGSGRGPSRRGSSRKTSSGGRRSARPGSA